jgi:hypothetical protein
MSAPSTLRLHRSILKPLSERGRTFKARWHGPDRGLIAAWEAGREFAYEHPDLASRAQAGELVTLPWKGGLSHLVKDKDIQNARKRKLAGSLWLQRERPTA